MIYRQYSVSITLLNLNSYSYYHDFTTEIIYGYGQIVVRALTFLILVLSWQSEQGILGCFYRWESYRISYQAAHWLFWQLVHNHRQFLLDGYPSPTAVQLVPEALQQELKKWKNKKSQQCPL